MKEKYVVASFSGGKDSTAMVLHMIELGEHLDEVICCDTYMEFPSMYEHIAKVKKIVEDNGIKFTELRSSQTFEYLMFDHKINHRNKALPERSGYSWAGPRQRWCTSKLKVDIINRYLHELKKKYDLVQCVGIAFDEAYRLERKNNQDECHKHPLVEWEWAEEQCLRYCYDKGFDWGGLYEIFRKEVGRCPRVSCWCCPLQSFADLRILRKNFPDLWQKLRDMDRRTWRKFMKNYSVDDLDVRFAFEEERQAQGLSITNKDFHTELKKRLGR